MLRNISCLVVVACILSTLQADQITLSNGDQVSGTVINSDRESLTMKTEFMGEITIQWKAIEGVASDQPLFVTSSDGQVLVGPVTTANGSFEVTTAEAGPVPVSKGSVASIRSRERQLAYEAEIERLRNPGLLDFWGGYLDAGLSLTQGNADTTTFNTSTRTERKTKRDKISIYATSLFARNSTSGISATTANAIRGGTRYDVNLNNRLFTFGFIDLESDEFQNLDFRNVLGGGLGWHITNTDTVEFDIFGGGSFNQEFFKNDVTRRSAEVVMGEELLYRLLEGTVFSHRLAFYPNLTETGEFRLQFDSSLVTQLSDWLGWHITLSDRFKSDPVPGIQRNDVLLSTGARISFGRGF